MRTLALALVALALASTPGCATAIASALGATGSTARAATDLDVAMASAAIESLTTSGGERHPAPIADGTIFGGEPSFVCTIPGDTEPQTLAASSLENAVAACAAMNAMPAGHTCACREAELGSTLPPPIASR